jgi:DNA polymerase I
VSAVRRYLTDKRVKLGKPRPVFLDMETDSRLPFSKKEQMRVLCWALVDPADGSTHTEVLAGDNDAAERDLLARLWWRLEEYDQVLAWNGERFDFPVLAARSKAVELAKDVRRWLWLDHMVLFKRMNSMAAESGDEKQSFALQAIATAVLGEGKDDFDAAKSWEAWAAGGQQRARLVTYCAKDTLLLHRLEEETGYVELLGVLCDVCNVPADTRGSAPMGQVEGLLLNLALERGVKFPTRYPKEGYQPYRGAFVMEPTCRGITRGVHVCDFSSLYPSIIRTWNMSPETKTTRPPLPTRPAYLRHVPEPEVVRPAGVAEVPITGVWFDLRKEGMLPMAVAELIRLRKVWNDRKAAAPPGTHEWKEADRRSTAYKIAANSFYGVVGSPLSRFFDLETAESVSQGGVWLIQETMKAAQAEGLEVVYGDSVTGDRPVVLLNERGEVWIDVVEEVWKEASKQCVDGNKELAFLPGVKALARDRSGRVGWYPLRYVVRHQTRKEIWQISSKRGQVAVTDDHSIMVGNERATPEQFLACGGWFDTLPAIAPNVLDEVDIMNEVGGVRYQSGYGRGQVERRFVAEHGWIHLGGRKGRGPEFRRTYGIGTPELKELLRVVAAYITEGYASLSNAGACRCMWGVSQADPKWLVRVGQALKVITKGLYVPQPKPSVGAWYLRSGTTMMARLFASMCGHQSRGKRLPRFVFGLPRDEAMLFWGYLVEGDGHVEAGGQASYVTTSAVLAAGVSYLLSMHGIENSIKYRRAKRSWTIRTRPVGSERDRAVVSVERYHSNGFVYDLSVHGAETFVDGVGRVLLHNTDSAFIKGCSADRFRQFVAHCNDVLYPRILAQQGVATSHIKLAYEKEFDRLVMISAKRYAGAYAHFKGTAATAESKPEVKGLEYKRGDTVWLARKLQSQVVDLLMGGEETVEPFCTLVGRWRKAVLEAPLELPQVVISKSLAKELREYAVKRKKDGTAANAPQHVEIAKELQRRGRDVGAGTKVSYVVVDGSCSPKVIVPAEDWDGTVDRFDLWESLVWPPTQRVLAAAFPEYDWGVFDRVRPRGVARKRLQAEKAGQGALF